MSEPFFIGWIGLVVAATLLHLSMRAGRGGGSGYDLPVLALMILALGAAWVLARSGDPQTITLISALLVAASALLGLVFNAAVARQAEARNRAERIRDIHRALYAEIAAQAANLVNHEALEAEKKAMLPRIAKGHVPLVLHEADPGLFAEVRKEIHILPRSTIDPIVNYYRQLDAIRTLIEDMRGETFRTHANADQRAAIYSDLIDMRKAALDFALASMALISVYAHHGPFVARKRYHELRNADLPGFSTRQGADRSGPSSE